MNAGYNALRRRVQVAHKLRPGFNGLSATSRFVATRVGRVEEGDVVLLEHSITGRQIITEPLQAGKFLSFHDEDYAHTDIIGSYLRAVIAKRGRHGTRLRKNRSRVFIPTLDQYVRLRPRGPTPIYPHDCNLIVSLLDIHVDTNSDLKILEAGTGNGALTLHLARAIHAANGRTSLEFKKDLPTKWKDLKSWEDTISISEWKSKRGAVIHTVEKNRNFLDVALASLNHFRRGMYAGDVDFHIGDVGEFIDEQIRKSTPLDSDTTPDQSLNSKPLISDASPGADGQPVYQQSVNRTPHKIYDHIILDLPAAHDLMRKAAHVLKDGGKLIVFSPSVIQIADCVKVLRQHGLPLAYENVLELGTGLTGGKQWEVRAAQVRHPKARPEPPPPKSNDLDLTQLTFGQRLCARFARWLTSDLKPDPPPTDPVDDNVADEWEMIARPSVGHKVVGGGFVGIWRRKRNWRLYDEESYEVGQVEDDGEDDGAERTGMKDVNGRQTRTHEATGTRDPDVKPRTGMNAGLKDWFSNADIKEAELNAARQDAQDATDTTVRSVGPRAAIPTSVDIGPIPNEDRTAKTDGIAKTEDDAKPHGTAKESDAAWKDNSVTENGTAKEEGIMKTDSSANKDAIMQKKGTAEKEGNLKTDSSVQKDAIVQRDGYGRKYVSLKIDGSVREGGVSMEKSAAKAEGPAKTNGAEKATTTAPRQDDARYSSSIIDQIEVRNGALVTKSDPHPPPPPSSPPPPPPPSSVEEEPPVTEHTLPQPPVKGAPTTIRMRRKPIDAEKAPIRREKEQIVGAGQGARKRKKEETEALTAVKRIARQAARAAVPERREEVYEHTLLQRIAGVKVLEDMPGEQIYDEVQQDLANLRLLEQETKDADKEKVEQTTTEDDMETMDEQETKRGDEEITDADRKGTDEVEVEKDWKLEEWSVAAEEARQAGLTHMALGAESVEWQKTGPARKAARKARKGAKISLTEEKKAKENGEGEVEGMTIAEDKDWKLEVWPVIHSEAKKAGLSNKALGANFVEWKKIGPTRREERRRLAREEKAKEEEEVQVEDVATAVETAGVKEKPKAKKNVDAEDKAVPDDKKSKGEKNDTVAEGPRSIRCSVADVGTKDDIRRLIRPYHTSRDHTSRGGRKRRRSN